MNSRQSRKWRCQFCRSAPVTFPLVCTYYDGHGVAPVRQYCRAHFPLCQRCYRYCAARVYNSERRRKVKQRGARWSLTPEAWVRKVLATKGVCQYCQVRVGYLALTIDHMQPIALGGDHSAENVLPVCQHCNAAKGCLPYQAWRAREELRRLTAIALLRARHRLLQRQRERQGGSAA